MPRFRSKSKSGRWWRRTRVLLGAVSIGAAVTPTLKAAMDSSYCAIPFFTELRSKVKPNVMILLDNSGSMDNQSYAGPRDARFDPGRSYYGYFNPARCYRYTSNRFEEGPPTMPDWSCTDPAWPFSGNFMNWAYMTRLEVAKKVLVGGRWNGASNRLEFEGDEWMGSQDYCFDPSPYTDLPSAPGVHLSRGGNRLYLRTLSRCHSSHEGEWGHTWWCHGHHCHTNNTSVANGGRLRILLPSEPEGIIQTMIDKARWGLAIFDNDGNYHNGGEIAHYMGFNDNGASLINTIRTMNANTWTPTAEALYTVMRYYQQRSRYFESDEYTLGPLNRDPFYEWEGVGDYVPCRESFVLVITDGKPTQDRNIPSQLDSGVPRDADGDGHDPVPSSYPNWPPPNHPSWPDPTNIGASNGSDYIDDVAFWGNTHDMRPDLAGTQRVSSYFVFAFGDTSATGFERSALWLLWHAAINGAFTDKNGNNVPDLQNEWDEDGDGDPDGFFLAEDGSEIEGAVLRAINAILKRTSSGTSVAVLSQSGEGEGALFQAYFNPEQNDGINTATWVGYLRGLWVDRFGNIREDSAGPGNLVLTEDKIIQYRFDPAQEQTFVDLYQDPDGDGVTSPSDLVGSVSLTELKSLFEAGWELFKRPPNTRQIYVALGGTLADFDTSNAALLQDVDGDGIADYLDVPVPEAADLIGYIRGADVGGWRNRTLTLPDPDSGSNVTNTWKLGDIAFSTPVAVGAPPSRYDLIYGDASYAEFFDQYAERQQIVYVGANDGMLHAFNVGAFRNGDNPATPEREDAYYDPDPNGLGLELGQELWAVIPQSLLPHLKWLKEPDYCHVYYVDGTPFVADVQLPSRADAVHPDGWHTILVGSLRLGCKPLTTAFGSTYRSSIFVLDVTDPFNPELLFEYTHPDLGFTTAQPVIAKVDGEWFLIFGSGPDKLTFHRTGGRPKLYVINLSGGAPSAILDLPGSSTKEHLNRAVAVDLGLDYDVDTIYVTSMIYNSDTDYDGKIYRISTRQGSTTTKDPTQWTISTAFQSNAPFSTALRFAIDDAGGGWLFVGTGRLEYLADMAYDEQQYFYGIRDDCADGSCTDTYRINDLVDVSNCVIDASTGNFVGGGCPEASVGDLCQTVSASQGWYVEFPEAGERNITRSDVINKLVVWSTFVPGAGANICQNAAGHANFYITKYDCGVLYESTSSSSSGGGSSGGGGGGASMPGDCDPSVLCQNPPCRITGDFITDSTGQVVRSDCFQGPDKLAGIQMMMTPFPR